VVEDRGFEIICKIIIVVWGTSVDQSSHKNYGASRYLTTCMNVF
jgi:hypothetical protein